MAKSYYGQVLKWNWIGFCARWRYRWISLKKWIDTNTKNTRVRIKKTHNFIVGILSPNYPIGRLYLFAVIFVGLTIFQMPTLAIGAGIFYICWILERRK